MPSLPNVLIRVRKLLAERLTRSPSRTDNTNLNNAVWDLHNLMPSDMQMSNIYHQLSSSKRDTVRYEDGVKRLAAWLESSPMTASTPGVRTAAAFYNQSVTSEGSNGKDAVIEPVQTRAVPTPPIPVPPVSRSAPMDRQSSMTVVPLAAAPAFASRPAADFNAWIPPPPQAQAAPQSDFAVAYSPPAEPVHSVDEAPPPGYTFVAEIGAPASPAPPPVQTAYEPPVPEKGSLPTMWQNPPQTADAGPSRLSSATPNLQATSSSMAPSHSANGNNPQTTPSYQPTAYADLTMAAGGAPVYQFNLPPPVSPQPSPASTSNPPAPSSSGTPDPSNISRPPSSFASPPPPPQIPAAPSQPSISSPSSPTPSNISVGQTPNSLAPIVGDPSNWKPWMSWVQGGIALQAYQPVSFHPHNATSSAPAAPAVPASPVPPPPPSATSPLPGGPVRPPNQSPPRPSGGRPRPPQQGTMPVQENVVRPSSQHAHTPSLPGYTPTAYAGGSGSGSTPYPSASITPHISVHEPEEYVPEGSFYIPSISPKPPSATNISPSASPDPTTNSPLSPPPTAPNLPARPPNHHSNSAPTPVPAPPSHPSVQHSHHSSTAHVHRPSLSGHPGGLSPQFTGQQQPHLPHHANTMPALGPQYTGASTSSAMSAGSNGNGYVPTGYAGHQGLYGQASTSVSPAQSNGQLPPSPAAQASPVTSQYSPSSPSSAPAGSPGPSPTVSGYTPTSYAGSPAQSPSSPYHRPHSQSYSAPSPQPQSQPQSQSHAGSYTPKPHRNTFSALAGLAGQVLAHGVHSSNPKPPKPSSPPAASGPANYGRPPSQYGAPNANVNPNMQAGGPPLPGRPPSMYGPQAAQQQPQQQTQPHSQQQSWIPTGTPPAGQSSTYQPPQFHPGANAGAANSAPYSFAPGNTNPAPGGYTPTSYGSVPPQQQQQPYQQTNYTPQSPPADAQNFYNPTQYQPTSYQDRPPAGSQTQTSQSGNGNGDDGQENKWNKLGDVLGSAISSYQNSQSNNAISNSGYGTGSGSGTGDGSGSNWMGQIINGIGQNGGSGGGGGSNVANTSSFGATDPTGGYLAQSTTTAYTDPSYTDPGVYDITTQMTQNLSFGDGTTETVNTTFSEFFTPSGVFDSVSQTIVQTPDLTGGGDDSGLLSSMGSVLTGGDTVNAITSWLTS